MNARTNGQRHRRRKAAAAVVVAAAAVLAVAGYGAYAVVDSGHGDGGADARTPVSLARDFLTSWSAGRFGDAAGDTDSAPASEQALKGYHDGLGVRSLTFSHVLSAAGTDPARAEDTVVGYHAALTLAGGKGTWSYDGSLSVHRTGRQLAVHWQNSVLYPGLGDGQELAVGAVPPSGAVVTAADGTVLTASAQPSLAAVIQDLTGSRAQAVRGSSGTGIEIRSGGGAAPRVLKVLTPPKQVRVRTTIDARLQDAAERAVRDGHNHGKPTALVAIDPATGQIAAIADTSGTTALSGALAPGSTMKLITASALLDKGGLTPSSPATCTPTVMVNGQSFHNVDNESATGSTMTQDFAMSCNTAFIRIADNHLGMTDLKDEADDVFGLDGDWKIGVGTVDASIPDPAGSRNERAGDSIGQGRIIANPLAMASVTATIAQGAFHQPILLPGLPQKAAARPISPSTAAAVRAMMRTTARTGTAAPRMSGITGGAKTGTAEVGNSTNGWFVAYDRHLAVAAVVQGGTSGVDSAGWAVHDLLTAD
ncbi:penicillin-binding transpeptidase domain-containing protein [Streptomyces sp. NBC_00448]|uniref:penicillin-binding transpeptidase domain-containing protein n=1 Tax=Streptomyces sp. NBC_00448 TaxID=2903652 RepID=UPI002E1F03DC